MGELTLSVSQISNYIKNIFEAEEMLIGVKVYGDITNLKPSSKAVYFDIKDESSALPCVCFDSELVNSFEFGDKVVVTGRLNYYTKSGRLSFIVSKLERYGIGDLYKEYLATKEKLEKEGLFDASKKKPLPLYPKRVGVVTSRTGAVIRDIIRVARSKNRSTDIVLFPAKVQGIGAKEDIIKGIKFLDGYNVDVIIVARGGGSFEDYQPFNTEEVARAVFECRCPIISAIGHENDWSIIDFVSDRRASTPSVASEIAFYGENEYLQKMTNSLNTAIAGRIKELEMSAHIVKDKSIKLTEEIRYKIDKVMLETRQLHTLLNTQIEHDFEQEDNKFQTLAMMIEKSNPMALLMQGYLGVSKQGRKIIDIHDIDVEDKIDIRFSNGVASAIVTGKEEK